jgi:hypothetical protein
MAVHSAIDSDSLRRGNGSRRGAALSRAGKTASRRRSQLEQFHGHAAVTVLSRAGKTASRRRSQLEQFPGPRARACSEAAVRWGNTEEKRHRAT